MRHGGGMTWMPGTYDPELHLYYLGTGNPNPVMAGQSRKGDDLWTCSIVALNVDTGKMAWYFQASPHDTHDWDAVQTPVIFDGNFRGEQRKLLIQASRNGYLFVLDRTNGKPLLSAPFANINWSSGVDATHAILAVDNSKSGAVYKGLTIATNKSGIFLYAANIHAGTIDVFDKNFAPAKLSGTFTDPYLPAGYAPFDIKNIGSTLYVAYAKQNAQKNGDQPGPGHGVLDTFDTNGNFIKRLVTHGQLNSPWGLALAPTSFGQFSNDLLVGNFGDGRINAFDPNTGAFLGALTNKQGQTIVINGLWSLIFGLGGQAGNPNQLFFTAGIHQEADGLFGVIQAM